MARALFFHKQIDEAHSQNSMCFYLDLLYIILPLIMIVQNKFTGIIVWSDYRSESWIQSRVGESTVKSSNYFKPLHIDKSASIIAFRIHAVLKSLRKYFIQWNINVVEILVLPQTLLYLFPNIWKCVNWMQLYQMFIKPTYKLYMIDLHNFSTKKSTHNFWL